MADLTLTTFNWVPEAPRGFVRDLRVRWALEEAALPYRVASAPFDDRGPAHLAHQPFGQVPWLTDGDISIFETGAILLHLGGLSEKLMPTDKRGRTEATEWVFAALNSVEMASLPWGMSKFMGHPTDTACSASSMVSARWRTVRPAVPTSHAPRDARRSPRRMPTRWPISLRRIRHAERDPPHIINPVAGIQSSPKGSSSKGDTWSASNISSDRSPAPSGWPKPSSTGRPPNVFRPSPPNAAPNCRS